MTWHFISTVGLSFKLFYTRKECEIEDESKEIHWAVAASKAAAEECSRGCARKYNEICFASRVWPLAMKYEAGIK